MSKVTLTNMYSGSLQKHKCAKSRNSEEMTIQPSLSGSIFLLLIIVSISLTIIISHDTFPLFHQLAMAQKTRTAASITNPSKVQTTTAANFLTYQNSTYGIKVQYPSTWQYTGSANTPISGNNSQVQPIVTFIPSVKTIHALVAVGTVNLPSFFKSIHIDNMSALIPFFINGIKQSTPDFQLVESHITTIGTAGAGSNSSAGSAATIPAYKIVYTASGDVHKVLAVFTIKGDKGYFISYITGSEAVYSSYLPIAQKMIDSFQIVNAKPTTTITTSAPSTITTVNATKPTGSPFKIPHSIVASSTTTSQKEIADFKAARERYLLAWNHTGFHSQFDSFVDSTQGFGVYHEHKSNLFKPGEPITLYVEPVGFTHVPVTISNARLYLINLTASIVLSDKQGNVLFGKENVPLLNVVSHNKNTEISVRLSVTQSSPFPAGNYVIAYTVNDVPSGKSFKIVKDIAIAGSGNVTNKTSTSTIQQPPPPNNSSAVPSSWHSYTNSTYGMALRYPPDWILSPLSQQQGTNNTVFEIMDFAPPISQDPTANTILGVGIDNTTRQVTPTLEQYLHDEINSYRSAANVTDFKVISAGTNVTVGGHPGYLLHYTEKLRTEPTPKTYLEAGTIAGNTIYYLSINSDLSDKQFTTVLLPQVMQIIKSFHILQPAATVQQLITK
jgi:hypothetical protein